MRKFIWGVAAAIAAFAMWAFALRAGAFAADPADALARYGAPPSQFAEIDGTRLHYRDEGETRGEGQRPVLVLLHGSRASLQQWDGWVAELGAQFRIVRVDGMGHGLSGPDGRNDYSAARQLLLLDKLFDHLGLTTFILGGTSSGATVAMRYTALHPARVEKLLLSTLPLRLPTRARTAPFDRAVFWFHDTVLDSRATDLYWRTFLRSIYADPDKVTAEMVTRYRILNTLPGQEEAFQARLTSWRNTGGAKSDFDLASKITVPTLIQWGAAGPVLPRELHCEIAGAFTGTAVRMISYRDLGHKLVLEDPVRTARDARAFIIDGTGGEGCTPAPATTITSSAAPQVG